MSTAAVEDRELLQFVREALRAFREDPDYLVSMARNSQRAESKRERLELSRAVDGT